MLYSKRLQETHHFTIDTNCGPLSDTNTSGNPNLENTSRKTSVVLAVVVSAIL